MDDDAEETFHSLRKELQKEKTASTMKLLTLLEMEQEMCELNMANQMLDVELQHRDAVRSQKAPPNASLPQVLFDEIRNDSVLIQDDFLISPPLFQRNVVIRDDVHYQNDYDKTLKY
ncbi:hypothetical protein RvY_12725 [Ramazzottius varieornatus]|uniref:Uncharacterized protein n=1 Tax=Ramazzottius varieornatus TaxID=947166 RepID=A0A1D1VPN0_RAMVA|nr:hypothetical protein RvY_12725 [Ramazzottius varieornatus]